MIKKIVVLSLLIVGVFSHLSAQYGLINTHSDADFNKGKELFFLKKYAASMLCFEQYLQQSSKTEVGSTQEARYYIAANAFELRKADAEQLLTDHLTLYPYSPFSDRVNAMLGTLQFDKKKYDKAGKYFAKVNPENLGSREKVDFKFCQGYAAILSKNLKQAETTFADLKNMHTRYDMAVSYYYGYTEYCLKNYELALPEFLKLEDKADYQNIVPYYIIQILYAQKNFDQLGNRAEKLLANNPNNPNNAEVYRILGEMAYRRKDYAKAVDYLKKYEKLFPQVLRNDMYLLGLSYFQLKEYANAIQYLSKVTTANDEMTENAYLHLGNSYVKQNDITNARLSYEASLRTNFNKTIREEALYNYALTTYQSTSAFGESIKAFEQLLSEFPDSKYNDKVYDYLTSVYVTSRNYQAAYESINKIKDNSPQLTETKQFLLYELGIESFVTNKPQRAVDFLNKALEVSPKGRYSAECLYLRGETFYRSKKYESCIKDIKAFFNNELSGSSQNKAIAYYTIAYAYFSSKKYTEALEWFSKYTENELSVKSSTYADALNRCGDCYYYQRSFTKAEEAYSKAIAASPNTGDYALFQWGYVAGLQKNYNQKIAKLEKLLNTYPKSEYTDDALYEMARSYLMMENNTKAIATFQRLLTTRPNSDLAPKAALETGMVYFNENNFEQAITAYKNVISSYPGSDESYTALESLETAYIEINDVPAYLAYTKTLGRSIRTSTATREDSISYIASEKQYISAKYEQAISGMKAYLSKFCPGGRYCTIAQYYLADSYYKSNDKENAFGAFDALTKITGNEYMEEAALRCAEISFDKKDYSTALNYFKKLESVAQNPENRNVGRLGVLRCNFFLKDHQGTINIANDILNDANSNEEVKNEALYNRAKACLELKKTDQAMADLKQLGTDTRTAAGAEARYLLTDLYFQNEKYTELEKEVMDFAKKNTPHQFWLARSFVVLSDMYIKQNNDFQAKQYLLSLQKNYTRTDEIQTLITERLTAIAEREKKTIIN